MNLPNVIMIHPSVTSNEIIDKSSLVITIRGTASLEATLRGKPSIVFKEDIGHTLVVSVNVLKNWEELPSLIKNSLMIKCKPSDIEPYFTFIKKNSFDFPNEIYSEELSNYFNYNITKNHIITYSLLILYIHFFLEIIKCFFPKRISIYINK